MFSARYNGTTDTERIRLQDSPSSRRVLTGMRTSAASSQGQSAGCASNARKSSCGGITARERRSTDAAKNARMLAGLTQTHCMKSVHQKSRSISAVGELRIGPRPEIQLATVIAPLKG